MGRKVFSLKDASRLTLLLLVSMAVSWYASGQTAAGGLQDVTADAVQTFYQNGAPHTDRAGNITTTYQADSSFFPRGIFFPEPCRRPYTFTWPPFNGTPPPGGNWTWDGKYQLTVSLVNVPPSSALFPDRKAIHDDSSYVGTSATVSRLPANEDLHWGVVPSPGWAYLKAGGSVLAQGTINLSCPPDDPDDPNVAQTLSSAGFNLALVKSPYHPQPFVNLKNKAGVTDFQFVIDARQSYITTFPDDLFSPPAQGGQGYSQHPDIYGWQTEDEPVLLANGPRDPSNGCKYAAMTDALQRITDRSRPWSAVKVGG